MLEYVNEKLKELTNIINKLSLENRVQVYAFMVDILMEYFIGGCQENWIEDLIIDLKRLHLQCFLNNVKHSITMSKEED